MDWTTILTFKGLAVLFTAVAYIPYFNAVLKGAAKPTLSAWVSGFVIDSALLAGMISEDKVAPQMYAYIAGIVAVITISLWKRAAMGWTPIDTICVVLVGAAVGSWWFYSDARFVITMTLFAMLVSFVPMFRNVWGNPSIEPFGPWLVMWIGGLFGILAIEEWSIVGASVQTVIFVLQISILLLISRRFLRAFRPV